MEEGERIRVNGAAGSQPSVAGIEAAHWSEDEWEIKHTGKLSLFLQQNPENWDVELGL